MADPKPTLPDESKQMPPAKGPKNPARRERRLAKRKANQDKKKKTPDPGTDGEYKKVPLSDEAKGWAGDVLSGDKERLGERNPYFTEMMDEKYADPTQNPIIQNMLDQMKRESEETFLQNLNDADTASEQGGRFGGDLWRDLRVRTGEEANEAYQQAAGGVLSGAYENERQRRAGLVTDLFGTQSNAARIPIEFGQLDVARGHLGVARGQLGLARSEFAFNKKMQTLAAQQDAVNDYMNILAGLGSMGGSEWGMNAGSFIPSQNPYAAALQGGMGGYMATQDQGA